MLFHKVKFGLQKPFLLYLKLQRVAKVFQYSSWKEIWDWLNYSLVFMQKIRVTMQSSQKYPLSVILHIGEFVVEGKEDGKQGRSYYTKKTKVVIAVELIDKNKVKHIYAKAIDDYSAKLLTPIFEEHISTSAKIFTDKWRGCSPLKAKYNIEQKESKNGKNFKEMNIVLFNN